MALIPQGQLFDWHQLDAASDLDRLVLVLEAIPDEPLVSKLEVERGRGRDEYPVRAVWNSLLAGVVFQHPSIASLRRELRRNAQLRKVCGFALVAGEDAIPSDAAYSRFLAGVIAHEPELRSMFHALVEALRQHLPDLGRFLAEDGKALPSFGKPSGDAKQGDAKEGDAKQDAAKQGDAKQDLRRENDADWGVKSYRGKRADGSAWEKVTRWFGFELHLLVDSAHELPLNYKLTKASASETTELLPLVRETAKLHPEVIANSKELAADKGYDSTENCRGLFDEFGIAPIIDKRSDWKKDSDPTRPLFPERADTVVYDVKGAVSCVCPATGEQRALAPWGFEPERDTLKYRCPAAANDYECKGRSECPGAQTPYGRIVRIKLDKDRRMFTPIPRDSQAWERAYDRRTAVERVNSRIDNLLGFEHHTIRGLKKMEARVGIAFVVMLSMALGRIRAGQRDQLRSLVAPVKRAA